MPRFHFNLSDGKRFSDANGVELADMEAARVFAVTYLADTLRDDPKEAWRGGEVKVEVAVDCGLTLCTVTLVCQDAPAAPRGRHIV